MHMDIHERFNVRELLDNITQRLANKKARKYTNLLYGRADELHTRRENEREQYGRNRDTRSFHRKTAWGLQERQERIRNDGLLAKLYFHEDYSRDPTNPFYSIRVQPIRGFIDTDSVEFGTLRHSQHPDRPHPYHISIGNLPRQPRTHATARISTTAIRRTI